VAAGAGHGAAAGREPDRPDGRGGGPDPAGLEVPARLAPGRPRVRPFGAARVPGEGRGSRGWGRGRWAGCWRALPPTGWGRGAGGGGGGAAHRFGARGRGGGGADRAGPGGGERRGRRGGPDGRAPGLGGRCPARERVDGEVRPPGPGRESPRLEEEAGRARR